MGETLKVLLTGSSGLIGSRVAARLLAAGHVLRLASRHPGVPRPGVEYVHADFAHDVEAAIWMPRLAGIDVVINAVGIFREQGTQRFEQLHTRTPRALFEACALMGVGRVINISALGADEGASSAYHRSKRAADDFLLAYVPHGVVVQPSLVFSAEGASSRQFLSMATWPLLVAVGGEAKVQPVHLDDVADAIAALAQCDGGTIEAAVAARDDTGQEAPAGGSAAREPRRIALAGPQALSLVGYLQALRASMGLAPAAVLHPPRALVVAAAAAGGAVPGSLFDREALRMLERGNVAGSRPLQQLIGRAPRAPGHFIDAPSAPLLRRSASLDWLLGMMRLAMATVWFTAAATSLGIYPRQDSYAMLARLGITGELGVLALVGAALCDLALGVATLAFPRRWHKRLWQAQIALILFYTVAIAWALPEYWRHPFGPIVKNLPILVALWMLIVLEQDADNAQTRPAR
ncbi:MAG: SDR family oxidoreductase [Massilia sp.]